MIETIEQQVVKSRVIELTEKKMHHEDVIREMNVLLNRDITEQERLKYATKKTSAKKLLRTVEQMLSFNKSLLNNFDDFDYQLEN